MLKSIPKKRTSAVPASGKIPRRAVAIFTHQLSTMLKSGIPLIRAIDSLNRQTEFPQFSAITQSVLRNIESGNAFSRSLARFPQAFSPIYVTMVEIGENSGRLVAALESLAGWLEEDGKMRQRLASALAYPLFVLILAFFLTVTMFTMVMPAFLGIFADMNVELPLITRVVLALTRASQSPLFWCVGLASVGMAYRWVQESAADPELALRAYRFFLRVPILGGMLLHGSLTRYCGAAQALLAAGIEFRKSFRLAAGASGSPLIVSNAECMVASVMNGASVSMEMEANPDIYPKILTQMIVVGEETARLPDMFGRAAEFHRIEMEIRVESFGAAMEPLLLILIGGVVSTIILSIFLPLYGYLAKLT